MSEGPFPKTLKEAMPYVTWGAVIFTFVFVFVEKLVEAEYGQALFALIGSLVMIVVALHSKAWLERTSPNWLYPGCLALVAAVVLSPFIEEHRWPFSRVYPPTVEEITKAAGDELKKITAERDDLKQRIAAEASGISQTASADDVAKATASLRAEKDKALKDRDAAIQDVADANRRLDEMRRELDAAREAAATRAPGDLTLAAGQIGAAILLYRQNSMYGTSFEVIEKSANIKNIEIQTYYWRLADPQLPTCSMTSCAIVSFIFDGSYGPFEASIQDPDAAIIQPKITIVQNGQVHLDAVVETTSALSAVLSGGNLHELTISIRKKN
jgi:hypothetical protein